MSDSMIAKTCGYCKKTYFVSTKHAEQRKYCSRPCAGRAAPHVPPPPRYGSDNHSWKGGNDGKIEYICQECGKSFLAHSSFKKYGKRFCSFKCVGRWRSREYVGAGNPAWKGGKKSESDQIRNQADYHNWREVVFRCDNWTCQDCEKRGGKLHAHHIFSFAEFSEHRLEVWNGVTLCISCHRARHRNLKREERVAVSAAS